MPSEGEVSEGEVPARRPAEEAAGPSDATAAPAPDELSDGEVFLPQASSRSAG